MSEPFVLFDLADVSRGTAVMEPLVTLVTGDHWLIVFRLPTVAIDVHMFYFNDS